LDHSHSKSERFALGLGGKLNFAFITVIGVMVAAHGAVEVYTQRQLGAGTARQNVQPIIRELEAEVGHSQEPGLIPKRNEKLADMLASDSSFANAYATRDRGALTEAVKKFTEQTGMSGFVAVFDSSGRVFYSGDSPAKFGYKPHDIAEDILENMHEGKIVYAPAAPTYTDQVCLIGMVPIRSGNGWSGMVAVCEPINSAYLTGLQEKMKITEGVQRAEMLMFSVKDGTVSAWTPGLGSDAFLTALRQKGIGLINEKGDFDRYGRYWTKYRFETGSGQKLAYLLIGSPMPDDHKLLMQVALESAVSLAAGILLSIMFTAAIAGGFDRQLRFLVQRAKDLQAQRSNIPSLDGLSREFRELGEQMDTAMSGTRISIKQLQGQSGKHQDELFEKQKLVEEANQKVEAINKQLTIQGKQLSEVSKQINQANSQAVVLQQKLASVLQISTEGFLLLDPYGNVMSANPAFQNWVGTNEAELTGKYCFDLIHKPDTARDNNGNTGNFSMNSLLPGDLINHFYPEGIIYNRYDESKQVEVLAHLQPIMTDDANVQGYVMVLRDKSLLCETSRTPDEVISVLQNSVRAPLAIAEEKWNRVLSTTKQSNNSQLGNTLVDLHLTYQQLLGVVDSILMMHTGIVPAAPIVREQISVARLIGECMEGCAQSARDHHVMLDYKTATGLPTTGVDEHLIRDSINQLLDKMLTVTAPGGRVRVESSAKNNEIRTSIFSSGPALPPEEVEDMFVGFIQGKHPEMSYSQRLSLYLVRNNIERIGGRIWAESDRGTYIYLVLPVQ